MESPARTQVTRILDDMSSSDPREAARLLPLVYDELRALAKSRLANEPAGLTLQATALVHEAYLRLVGSANGNWDSRGHFFAAAAEAMRRILVERARRVAGKKRGGGRKRLDLDSVEVSDEQAEEDILALDEALAKLESEDRIRSDVVKLRYFAGLTVHQTAEVLDISPATVARYWTFAKAWLYEEMNRDPVAGGGNP